MKNTASIITVKYYFNTSILQNYIHKLYTFSYDMQMTH